MRDVLVDHLTLVLDQESYSHKLRYIVGFWLVEMAISTNQKPTIYRNLYDDTGLDSQDDLSWNTKG